MELSSPEARGLDDIQTPDSGGAKRQFGVRRRRFGASAREVENAHDGVGGGADTAAFERVKMQRGVGRHQSGMDVDSSGGAPTDRGNDRGHGQPKYTQPVRTSIRPGSSIRPGASIMATDAVVNGGEEAERLNRYRAPPKEQDKFINTILSKRVQSQPQPRMRAAEVPPRSSARRIQAAGGLEVASKPSGAIRVPTSIPSRDGWIAPARLQRETEKTQPATQPRPKRCRVELSPSPSSLSRPSEKGAVSASMFSAGPTRNSQRLLNRPARLSFGMYDSDPESPPDATVAKRYAKKKLEESGRSGTPTNLAVRRSSRSQPKSKEGTEDMPIHLSDSEEDEDDAPSALAPSLQDSDRDGQDGAFSDTVLDFNSIRKKVIADLQGHRVWIGTQACRVDVYFCEDAIWLCSIRAADRKWSLKPNYRIPLARVKRAKIYRWEECQAKTFDTSDPAGKVMSTISFIAFQFPIPDVRDKQEWREFYDPESKVDSAKRHFIIVSKDEDRDGTSLGTVEDVFRGQQIEVELLNTLDDVRPYATAMIEHDSYYVFHPRPASEGTRRSRRRREADDDMDVTQLTYPLPPCNVDIVTISRQDISRLQPAEYLNDNIIDYYLKRLVVVDFASNDALRHNVLFLSSHFYSRLRAGRGDNQKERLAAGYKNVSTWLTRSDLFNRSLVFVPINKDLHWSLAIIVNPRCAGEADDTHEANTCIALLDPLGSYHSSVPIMRNLKSFLEFEWKRVSTSSDYQSSKVSKIQVSAPLQRNSFDCGVFVLKYAQEMLTNFARLLAHAQVSTKRNFCIPRDVTDDGLAELMPQDAFTSRDVTDKRKELQDLLAEDTERYEAIVDSKMA